MVLTLHGGRAKVWAVFGVSMSELVVIALVVLIVVGPHKLPGMFRTLGEWIRKAQQLTSDVRQQTGIDQLLRAEGIEGLDGLRSMLRGDLRALVQDVVRTSPKTASAPEDPYAEAGVVDRYREYPLDGADAAGALPDDLAEGWSPPSGSGTAQQGEGSP